MKSFKEVGELHQVAQISYFMIFRIWKCYWLFKYKLKCGGHRTNFWDMGQGSNPHFGFFLVFHQLKMYFGHVAVFVASNYDDETMEVNFVIYFIQASYFWNYGGTYFLTSRRVWRNLTARSCYKIHQNCIKMNKWNIECKKKNNQDTAFNSSPFYFHIVSTPPFS